MGRRKKCEQIKRTNNVMVRFTDAEYASISISAEQAGYPVAVYVGRVRWTNASKSTTTSLQNFPNFKN